ncbi:hypothetical protein QH639_00790 [Lysinibacillus sp. 1 U-2021]|uniref:hypothetical protein n=1 Tax=Lysinibacillus sp. 1 U-2021 TaxID=3039426 RepID=UPI0024804600|nr:hypothetical protein [Lysinibacillus sp. 1 U-2021]WGT39398.1 hypothetical protein QH639_00790 [Lysinibacillus sp. 1 U-2021]
MAIVYNFSNKTFRDITKERVDVVKIASGFMGGAVKVYERNGTVIIHSENKKSSHASVSNEDGQVSEWEIRYAIEHILKRGLTEVNIKVSDTGVVHICNKEIISFFN